MLADMNSNCGMDDYDRARKRGQFASWVAATARLFQEDLAAEVADTALHFLMLAMVKREQAQAMRRSGDWSLASLNEAEARASRIGAVFFAGLESFFEDAPFGLDDFRVVRLMVVAELTSA